MKRKFRIIKITTRTLGLDNETVEEKSEYRIQQKYPFLLGWRGYGFCAGEWRSFNSEEEAMKYLHIMLQIWWIGELENRKQETARKKLKKQLKTTITVVGKYTFKEKDLNKLLC